MGSMVSVLVDTSFAQREKMTPFVTCVLLHSVCHPLRRIAAFSTWFGTGAAIDIAVAVALLWELSRIKSSFQSTQRCISITFHDWS